MKLKELLETGDFSGPTQEQADFSNYYSSSFSRVLYENDDISDEHYQAVWDSKRATRIALREWLCTDTNVGVYLYFVDGVPVCISYQSGRKCQPEWEFLSRESFSLVQSLFDDCKPVRAKEDIPIISEFLELDISSEKFDCQVSRIDVGYSPIGSWDILKKHNPFEKISKDQVEHILDILVTELDSHYRFMETLEGHDYQRAYDESIEVVKLVEATVETLKNMYSYPVGNLDEGIPNHLDSSKRGFNPQ